MSIRRTCRRAAGLTGALALLAGGLLGSGAAERAEAAPGPLGTAAPFLIYDAVAGAAMSNAAGATNYIVKGDFNLDGYIDLINFTSNGAQVFHNAGTNPMGVFSITLAQEISDLDFSFGGGAIDIDRDGDLDVVAGEVHAVAVLLNDGTGHFSYTHNCHHGYLTPTIAVPFETFDNSTAGPIRVVLAAAAESVTNDLLGPNPLKKPFAYVLEYVPATNNFTVVDQLDPINADGVTVRNMNAPFDNDNDIIITNRTNTGAGTPFAGYFYPFVGGSYPAAQPFNFSGVDFNFGFDVSVTQDLDIVFGTWDRASYLERIASDIDQFALNAATSWAPAFNINLDPSNAFTNAECFATEVADMDGDGLEDAVLMGMKTPLVITRLNGMGNNPAHRFTGAPVAGSTFDISAADWDNDIFHAVDVISGGTQGLYFHRNLNGGSAGSPVTPVDPECHELIQSAYFKLVDLVDPTRQPPLPLFLERVAAGDALSELIEINPTYVDHGLPATNVAELNQHIIRLNNANALLGTAETIAFFAGDTANVALIQDIRQDLVDAANCIADDILDLLMPPKRAPGRKLQRERVRAMSDRDTAFHLSVGARIETDMQVRGDLLDESMRLAVRSIKRGIKIRKKLGL